METRALHWLEELLAARGLSKETLESRAVSEQHRQMIAQGIGTNWETFAPFIGVSDLDVDDIKATEDTANMRCALMKRWHQLHGSDATYVKLIGGLMQIGRRDLIEKLLDQFHDESRLAAPTNNRINVVGHKMDLRNSNINSNYWSQHQWCCFVTLTLVLVLTIVSTITLSYIIIQPYNMRKGPFEVNVNVITELQTYNAYNGDNSSSFMYTDEDSSSYNVYPDIPVSDSILNQSVNASNDVFTNCSPPGSDLPSLNQKLFLGRENDISKVVSMMASAHIININGAPGIGKSTLAIHVGYEMIRNGNSVRYINMDEKVLLFKKKIKAKERVSYNVIVNHYYSEQSRETRSVIEVSIQNLIIFNYESVSHDENHGFIQELQAWSDSIHCRTVLILDNCDDILASSSRDDLVSLIYSLVNRSQFNLHVIIVSREKLFRFKHWTVPNLSLSASVHFLELMAPAMIDLKMVAKLVEGNPLALKIVGNLIGLHEVLKLKINILDQTNFQREPFRIIFDVAFTTIEELKECGYILGLFPGSFEATAGIYMTSKLCFELYRQHSLFKEYNLAYYHRYEMHRVLREYVKEKQNSTIKVRFNTRFKNYYREFLLEYARRKTTLDIFDRYYLSLETHNFELLKDLLLQDKQQSAEQLAGLVFLANENHLQFEELYEYFNLYVEEIGYISRLLGPVACGELYFHLVKYYYQTCKCETLTECVLNVFKSTCKNFFKCVVIDQITNIILLETRCTELSYQEKQFITFVGKVCFISDHKGMLKLIVILVVVLLLFYILCVIVQHCL